MIVAWSVLYDQVSGYPYYWNPSTNEVKWEKPLDLEGKANDITKQMNEDNAVAKVRYIGTSIVLGETYTMYALHFLFIQDFVVSLHK